MDTDSPMLVRRTTGESGSASALVPVKEGRGDGRGDAAHLSPMARGKSQRQLEARPSDPLPDTVGAGGDPDAAADPEKATESQSVFNLVNAVLGAGVLGFPWAFKTCGLVLATLLVLITLVASELSMRLLMISSQLAGKRSYEELARHCFGRVGQRAVDFCVIIMNIGSLVAYLNILADMFSSVAGTIIPPGAEPSRNMLLLGITLCGPLPVALFVRSPQLLGAVSQASVGFLFFFCAMIAALALSSPIAPGSLTWWEWDGVLVAFPVVAYGFCAHQILFSIYSSMRSASLKRMTGVIQRSMLMSSVVYVVVGGCGFLAFGQRASGDMLRNFGGPSVSGVRLLVERGLKVGYGVSILATVPLILIPLHSTFAPLVDFANDKATAATLSLTQEYAITTGVLGAALAMAVLLPNVEYVFGLAGSTASVLLGFIMPAAIFLQATSSQRGMLGHNVDMLRGSPRWKQRRRMAAFLLLFGVLAGVGCTRALVASIQEEAEVVQLAQELVREEAKVMRAAETESKAKEVVETMGAVTEATQQLNSAQAETSATLGVVMRATEVLDQANRPKDGSTKAADAAHKELTTVQGEVDKTLAKLETVTAALGETAKKYRNETAANLTSVAAAAAAAAAQNASAAAVAVPLQVGTPGRGGNGANRSDAGAPPAAPSVSRVAVAAAEQALDVAVAAKIAAEEQPRLEETAHTIHSVYSSANDTLHVVKQSKAALQAVQEAASSRKGGEDKGGADLDAVMRHAVNATGEAAARMNATMQALRQVEATQKEELLTLVTRLADDEGREEEQRTAQAKYEVQVSGRKEAMSGRGTAPGALAPPGADANATAALRPPADSQRARDALKQISGSDGKAVNVTEVAQAAADVAAGVVQTAKATVEQTIEKKKSGVAVRAIEIAKELTGGAASRGPPGADGAAAGGEGSASSSSSVLHAAALQAQEKSKAERNQTSSSPPLPPVEPEAGLASPANAASPVESLDAEGPTPADVGPVPPKAKPS